MKDYRIQNFEEKLMRWTEKMKEKNAAWVISVWILSVKISSWHSTQTHIIT